MFTQTTEKLVFLKEKYYFCVYFLVNLGAISREDRSKKVSELKKIKLVSTILNFRQEKPESLQRNGRNS